MAHVGPHAMDQAQIMLENSPATQAQMDITQRMVHDGKSLSVLLSYIVEDVFSWVSIKLCPPIFFDNLAIDHVLLKPNNLEEFQNIKGR